MINKSTTFYIVRHGQTEWNRDKIIQGQKNSELTSEGQAQAQLMADRFKDHTFHAIYASDLTRAQRTAEIIAQPHGLPVCLVKDLRERAYGSLEGIPRAEADRRYGEALAQIEALPFKERLQARLMAEMESDQDLMSRFASFLESAKERHMGETLLVVSHAGMMRALLFSLDLATHQTLPTRSIANTGYLCLRTTEEGFEVVEMSGITIDPNMDRLDQM